MQPWLVLDVITGRPPELQVVVDRLVVGLKTSVICKMLGKKNDDRILSFENLFAIVIAHVPFWLSSPRPERHLLNPASKTSIAVKLDFVEPFLAFRQLVDQPCIHWLDEPDFGGRPRTEGFGCHEEYEREPSVLFSVLLDQPSRPGEHLRWNRHADLLRRLEIDYQLELCRLLDRQVGRLRAF
jgi:hypothetical protein